MTLTAKQTQDYLYENLFGSPVFGNSFRGFYVEAMLSAQLGERCTDTPAWHPWDLTIGEETQDFPDRIRLQVKNTAKGQQWEQQGKPEWKIPYKKQSAYYMRDYPGVPCEKFGFMADVFVLAYHDGSAAVLDQREPSQWKFYLLNVRESSKHLTEEKIASMDRKVRGSQRESSTKLYADKIDLPAYSIDELSVDLIRRVVGL